MYFMISRQTLYWHVLLIFYAYVAPPAPTVGCSLTASPGAIGISVQWSPSFTSLNSVARYRVSVPPELSSCSGGVSSSEDYSCSGLVLGTIYTFTVSAITDCGGTELEGERDTFSVQPQGIMVLSSGQLFSDTCIPSHPDKTLLN